MGNGKKGVGNLYVKTHGVRCAGCMAAIFIFALLPSTPIWGQQKEEAAKQFPGYFDLLGIGGDFSKQGICRNITFLQFGYQYQWQKEVGLGLEMALGEFISDDENETITHVPLGVYLPILTVDWPAGDDTLISVLNLVVRTRLLDYFFPEDYNEVYLPGFLDVCLEWRSILHTISIGYHCNEGQLFFSARVGFASAFR